MPSNRLAGFLTERRPARFSFEITARRQPTIPQQAFVMCPVAFVPAGNAAQLSWQMSIYRLAYEQARAAVAARERARELAFPWN
jgi:hypothetical protein